LFLGFCSTLFLAVYPDQVLKWINLPTGATDYALRLFPLINAAFLALFASLWTTRLVADRVPKMMPDLRSLPVLTAGAQEAYRSIVIHAQFPSFPDQKSVLEHLTSAVILANYKPVEVSSFSDLERKLSHRSVVALVVDKAVFDDALPRARGTGVMLYTVEPHHTFEHVKLGSRVTLRLGNEMGRLQNIFTTAWPLAHAHTSDVVRATGFHGTWVTTYGLMAVKGSTDGRAQGVYWYGKGEISGMIEVNQPDDTIIMRFDWSQAQNDSRLGSTSQGKGVFVLVAGYEVFLGYWYRQGDPSSTQLWSGTRLSHDILTDLRNGGKFASQFGLEQHALEKIVDPGASER
jgi:hypothetical protein